MIKYIALISHDDECEIVPLGVGNTAEEALTICENAAKENDDPLDPYGWEKGQHSRMQGHFIDQQVGEYTYYVRPIEVPE